MVWCIKKPISQEARKRLAEIEDAINKRFELTGDNGPEEPPLMPNIVHDTTCKNGV
jgi:hypothetical protein